MHSLKKCHHFLQLSASHHVTMEETAHNQGIVHAHQNGKVQDVKHVSL